MSDPNANTWGEGLGVVVDDLRAESTPWPDAERFSRRFHELLSPLDPGQELRLRCVELARGGPGPLLEDAAAIYAFVIGAPEAPATTQEPDDAR